MPHALTKSVIRNRQKLGKEGRKQNGCSWSVGWSDPRRMRTCGAEEQTGKRMAEDQESIDQVILECRAFDLEGEPNVKDHISRKR
jgi:hypothetical protein